MNRVARLLRRAADRLDPAPPAIRPPVAVQLALPVAIADASPTVGQLALPLTTTNR